MWFPSLLLSLLLSRKPGAGRRPNARRHPAPQRRSFVPRLEALEDRTVPSTLTVLNNLDKGADSLRDAIGHARDGDSIVFTPSLAGQTITLTSGALVVKNSVDIEGPGASLLAVSGNDTSRVFDISAGLSVTIAGLTVTHGRAALGGGILNVGSALTVAGDVLSYNEAVREESTGGAISNRNGASLIVTASTFIANRAIGIKDGGQGVGGAISNKEGSTATVSRSTFIGNRAVGGDGGVVNTGAFKIFIGGGQGGAISNDGRFSIESSTFIDNQAIGGNGGSGGKGASFYAVGYGTGGAVVNQPSLTAVLVIDGCTFTANEAIGGSNATGGASGQGNVGNARGGALINFGVATVTNSTFDHNEARAGNGNSGGGGSVTVGQATGGAIANSGVLLPATLTVSNSTFTNNQAVGGAGTVGGSFAGIGLGGGVATLSGATTTLTSSTFTGNQAVGGAGGAGGSGGNGFGGGVYNDGRSTLEVRGSTITDNQATGGSAGSGGSAGTGVGGGAYFAPGGTVCLDAFTQAYVKNNHASTSDDDLFGVFTTCP
ncbi:MAG: hypothetical protein HYS12_14590 [Planctomycetes bacterium]|nr:hypothetical protein [Planctomycetota bacterium]